MVDERLKYLGKAKKLGFMEVASSDSAAAGGGITGSSSSGNSSSGTNGAAAAGGGDAPTDVDYGRRMALKFRAQMGGKDGFKEFEMSIGEREPFSNITAAVAEKLGVGEDQIRAYTVDEEECKKPADEDLEDGEIVDIKLK